MKYTKETKNKPHIIFDRVSKKLRFTDENIIEVFSDLKLIINKGEQIGIYGVESSGINDLMNILLCNDEPDSGTIIVGEEDIMKLGSIHRQQLVTNKFGYISKELINENLTFGENIELILIDYKIGIADLQERITKILEELDLLELKDKPLYKLDLTSKVLCMLAASLVKNPELLVVNKLPYGMHQSERYAFISKIIEVSKSNNITLICFTDDIRLASKFRKTIRLEDGKLN
jgi:ABC-type lipoprotein export system ATPase subunit